MLWFLLCIRFSFFRMSSTKRGGKKKILNEKRYRLYVKDTQFASKRIYTFTFYWKCIQRYRQQTEQRKREKKLWNKLNVLVATTIIWFNDKFSSHSFRFGEFAARFYNGMHHRKYLAIFLSQTFRKRKPKTTSKKKIHYHWNGFWNCRTHSEVNRKYTRAKTCYFHWFWNGSQTRNHFAKLLYVLRFLLYFFRFYWDCLSFVVFSLCICICRSSSFSWHFSMPLQMNQTFRKTESEIIAYRAHSESMAFIEKQFIFMWRKRWRMAIRNRFFWHRCALFPTQSSLVAHYNQCCYSLFCLKKQFFSFKWMSSRIKRFFWIRVFYSHFRRFAASRTIPKEIN